MLLSVQVTTGGKMLHVLKLSVMSAGLVLALTAPTFAQAPDNTKVNERDRSKSQPTADQARNNLSDREIMQRIRKAVVGDKSLSTYGHNVKIISTHGKVTLKGPVHSDEERRNIEAKAVEVAGSGNVTNMIDVKGEKAQ
jgi:hyperosmotically inducible protein